MQEEVSALRSVPHLAVGPWVDQEFVEANPNMFLALKQRWICRKCREQAEAGEMPHLAATNGLPTSWAELPPELSRLSPLEAALGGQQSG